MMLYFIVTNYLQTFVYIGRELLILRSLIQFKGLRMEADF